MSPSLVSVTFFRFAKLKTKLSTMADENDKKMAATAPKLPQKKAAASRMVTRNAVKRVAKKAPPAKENRYVFVSP